MATKPRNRVYSISQTTEQLKKLAVGEAAYFSLEDQPSLHSRAQWLGITIITRREVMGAHVGKLKVWRTA